MDLGFFIYYFILIYSGITYYCDFIYFRLFEWDLSDPEHYETYDFIVVGAGSAGSIVANRLSKNNRVLLLEAGGDPHPLVGVPAMSTHLANHPAGDWLHKTVPQKNCCQGLTDHSVPCPRGKMLGGSSSINYMIYNRGHPKDFDNWANMTGDPQWLHKNVIRYFKKFEDYHGNYAKDETHSVGGPLHIEKLKFEPAIKFWMKGSQELGYKQKDLNHFQEIGFSPVDYTMKDGARASTYKAYLEPILGRKNLTIYRYSHVTKIHLDRSKMAYGVSYEKHGVKKFVRATKEVIVSGGAFDSPRLLMLSGIGPKKHLKSLGIKSKADLPVGQNLQDHVITLVGPFLVNESVSFLTARDAPLSGISQYRKDGSGYLQFTAITGSAVTASSLAKDKTWPDLFYFFVPVGVNPEASREMESMMGFKPGYLDRYMGPNIGNDSFSVIVSIGRPNSVGEISLKKNDPQAALHIDPKYLTHPDDLKIIIEGVKLVVNLFENTKTFQAIGTKLIPEKFPGCENIVAKTDEYWKCYVKHFSGNLFHQSGTCKMGRKNDPTAVLDSNLRVLGVSKLRVIDASIMPKVTNANTNAPTIMIGEKGADIIRKYWAEHYKVCDKHEHYAYRDYQKSFYSQNS